MNSRFRSWCVVPFLALLLLATGSVDVRGDEPEGSTIPALLNYLPLVGNTLPFEGTEVTAIDSGGEYTCALSPSGQLFCWGINYYGQQGNGTFNDVTLPTLVQGFDGKPVTSFSTGYTTACAITIDGALYCWGFNIDKQIVDDENEFILHPTYIERLAAKAVQVEVGSRQICVLLENQSVHCWGTMLLYNLFDDGAHVEFIFSDPRLVEGLEENVVAISLMHDHGCALMEDGSARCWGTNEHGQLGTGTVKDSDTAQPVVTLANLRAVEVGEKYSCALDAAEALYCWGRNEFGQLGIGEFGGWKSTPAWLEAATAKAVSLDVGSSHSCLKSPEGDSFCWGRNLSGQAGNGNETDQNVPSQVLAEAKASALAPGTSHTCMLPVSGDLLCWGSNDYGELGNGTVVSSLQPVAVVGLKAVE